MARPPKHALAADELARLAGVAESTLQLHKKAGAPMPKTKADIPKWLPEYHTWKDQRRRPAGGTSAPVDAELLQHRRELAKYRAMREKLDMAQRQGQLVPRAAVVDYASEAILANKQANDSAIRRLAAKLGPLTQGGAAIVEQFARAEWDLVAERFSKSMARTYDRNS